MFGLWKDIDSNSDIQEYKNFENELMSYVQRYTIHPKTKEENRATSINDCTSSILCGIEVLGRCGRMDTLSKILDKLISSRDHLQGVRYKFWIRHIARLINQYPSKNNLGKLLMLNNDAFILFVKDKKVSDHDISYIKDRLKDASKEENDVFDQIVKENYKNEIDR